MRLPCSFDGRDLLLLELNKIKNKLKIPYTTQKKLINSGTLSSIISFRENQLRGRELRADKERTARRRAFGSGRTPVWCLARLCALIALCSLVALSAK